MPSLVKKCRHPRAEWQSCDCDANQLYYWERGRRTPDMDRVEALIRLLGMPEEQTWALWREASMRKPKQPRPRANRIPS